MSFPECDESGNEGPRLKSNIQSFGNGVKSQPEDCLPRGRLSWKTVFGNAGWDSPNLYVFCASMEGTLIAQYKILEKIGEGGMGIVYKAEDTKLGRLVALKFLPSRLNSSAQDKARFIQEARAASSLNHPNVCTIHDIQESDSQIFIVMELVEGQTLREKMPTINTAKAIEIGIQIAEGLAAAHEKGIVHRDIKPEN